MTDKVRLRDVAQAAGVSQGTASNAFARPNLVSEELRAKVLATAARLGYRGPSVQGRLLRAGRVNAIGVATTRPRRPAVRATRRRRTTAAHTRRPRLPRRRMRSRGALAGSSPR